MLIVLTPATATRLTTVDAVRARCGIAEAQATNAVIEGLIDTASQMAVAFCNRSFGRETVKQTDCGGCSRILLQRSPASIAEVTESGEDVPADGYYLETTLNVLLRLSGDVITTWGGRVEVTYDAGWLMPGQQGANLPATIEHAALLLIGALWSTQQREPGLKSESVEGIGRTDYWVPGAGNRLPDPTAESLLQPYRRYFI